MQNTVNNNREAWRDIDWATYLGCPVEKIPEYKKFLDENYVITIEQNKNTKLYSMFMYRYDIAPSGFKRLQLIASGKEQFADLTAAIHNANDVISKMEFSAFWAEIYDVPAKVLQMMLIREK